MKKIAVPQIFSIISIIIISFLVLLLIDQGYTTTPIKHHYNIEAFEWVLFSLILPIINIWLWKSKTLWPKTLNWEEHVTYKAFKKGTVSNNLFYFTTPILLALIIFLPNDWGWLNHISYVNAKIFIGAIFTTILIAGIVKHTFQRKRPDFDERVKNNIKVEEGYSSFFSTYSSIAFCSAVFFSLFIIEHFEVEPIIKAGIVLTLLGIATFTSITRIIDNKSHSEDVFVGAFVGSLIGLIFYATPNDWFGQVYTRLADLNTYLNIEQLLSIFRI